LRENEVNVVTSRLQVMLPALTQSALSWHRSIEDVELGTRMLPSETEAAVAVFWYRVRSHRGKRPELFHRDLREYVRGEFIRDLNAPRPRLI